MNKPLLLPLAMGLTLCGAYALAEDTPSAVKTKTQYSAEIEAGLEYDSNLSVEELDRVSTNSDTARLLKAKADGQWGLSERLTLKGGYSYLGKHYEDFSEFDLTIHQFFADAAYAFSPMTVGVSHYYALAQLDGDDFLDLNLSSIYASKLIDNKIFLRAAANFQDKRFDGRSERNADNTGLDADAYYFFNQGRSFVSVGFSVDTEDARADEFDYDSQGVKAKVQNKFQWLGKASKAALGYRYEDRDYDNTSPGIGRARSDIRQSTKLSLDVELIPQLEIISALEYRDYKSNLKAVDYSEKLLSLSLRYKL